MSTIAPALVCTLKFVNSFTRRQHLFDVTTLVDIDSNLLSYPAPLFMFLFRPKCNNLICWFHCLPPANFIKIHSVLLWSERNTDGREQTPGQVVRWTRQKHNASTVASSSLLPQIKEDVHVLPVFVSLSVCLFARLLKNVCMDLDEMLHVDMSGHGWTG